MAKIEVFDSPMCCSTGVCGPEPDEQLAVFSADLDWLKRQGVEVRRYNLTQEPLAFTANAQVQQVLKETGGDALPVVLVDGQLVSQGEYPSRQRLAEFVGLENSEAANIQAMPELVTLTLQQGGGCCGGSDGNTGGCC